MNKGILKASKEFWESSDMEEARAVLKAVVNVIKEEPDPSRGVYKLYCESNLFDENKYGSDYEYGALFTRTDEGINVEIMP
ncbi:hypothetical protein ES707_11022 [subsurface metagenome]